MAKNTQRQRKITVGGTLTLGTTALIRRKSGNGHVIGLGGNKELTAAYTVKESESGSHFFLNTATAFITTLPAVKAGLEYFFHIGSTVPTTTHTIVTDGSANVIQGNLTSPEDAAGAVATVADADKISFVANLALHGDFAHVYSDGINWYLDGMCKVQDGMTTTST